MPTIKQTKKVKQSELSRNQLQKKVLEYRKKASEAKNAKNIELFIQKLTKYESLLEKKNQELGVVPLELDALEGAINSYYKGPLLDAPQLTTTRHRPFEDIFGTPFAADYKIIQTFGDGDCLVHAILSSISPTYQRIPFDERSSVGGHIRRDIIAPLIKNQEIKEFFQSYRYLEDQHLLTLSKILNYNFIIFQEVPTRHRRDNLPPNARNNINFLDIKATNPWILLHNKLATSRGADHYSAVKDPQGRLIIPTYEEGLETAKQLSGQTNVEGVCTFNNDEIVIYNSKPYIIEFRYFKGDPLTCYKFDLRDIDTGAIIKDISIEEISQLAGGGKRKQKIGRRRQTRRKHNHKRSH